MGHARTVSVSPQSKIEFLMLVNLAMGLEVSQGLSIDECMHRWVITFEGDFAQAVFFEELHNQWVNKDLKKNEEIDTVTVSVPNLEVQRFLDIVNERFGCDQFRINDSEGDFRTKFFFSGDPELIQKLDGFHCGFMRSLDSK